MKTTKLKWLVVNLSRGLFDGWYATREHAEDSLAGWREQMPTDVLVIAQVEDPHAGIPDARWMANFTYRKFRDV